MYEYWILKVIIYNLFGYLVITNVRIYASVHGKEDWRLGAI